MVNKRKLKTPSEVESPASKIVKDDERKEKLVPFDLNENECDILITTKENEVLLPSGFLKMLSNGEDIQMTDGKMKIDVSSACLVHCLSFYNLRNWDKTKACKFYISVSNLFIGTVGA